MCTAAGGGLNRESPHGPPKPPRGATMAPRSHSDEIRKQNQRFAPIVRQKGEQDPPEKPAGTTPRRDPPVVACFHPVRAWRTRAGVVSLGREPNDSESMQLPCGGCIGCRRAKAKAWSLRCQLELQRWDHAAFTTLTYDPDHVPVTLTKRHLQLFLKRLRRRLAPTRTLRFFACGEYGEENGRPHFHAILYGLNDKDAATVSDCWRKGYAQTLNATPFSISYVAGYTAKKYGDNRRAQEEIVDQETGEVYNWVPPFLQMSRNPGIGGDARKHRESWRSFAVQNGHIQPVPRYLHDAWEKQATQQEKDELADEKYEKKKQIVQTRQQREAAEKIALTDQRLRAAKRKL